MTNKFQIESNIPIKYNFATSQFQVMHDMKSGDSFACTLNQSTAARNYARKHKIPITVRKFEGGLRVWRL